MTQYLTAVINGHVVRVTMGEWEALRRHGATDEILRGIAARIASETVR